MKLSSVLNCLGCIAVGVGLSACAATGPSVPQVQHLASPDQSDDPKPVSDPNEQWNRSVFESNQKFNHAVLYPVAKAYNENVPEEVRDRIEAFTTNLSEPIVFANDILQVRPTAAFTTLGRFAINSTIGLAGLFDVAAVQGLDKQSGDFGQTMYVWGYRDSDYVVLPIVGPSNVRDAIGSTIEFAAQLPAGAMIPTKVATLASRADLASTITSPLTNLSKVEDMQTLEDSSIDFYSMLRSVSDQKRQAELQEALETSVLTGNPPPPNPGPIEPVMELVSSPMMLEKWKVTDVPKASASTQHGSIVVIGPPTAVPAAKTAD